MKFAIACVLSSEHPCSLFEKYGSEIAISVERADLAKQEANAFNQAMNNAKRLPNRIKEAKIIAAKLSDYAKQARSTAVEQLRLAARAAEAAAGERAGEVERARASNCAELATEANEKAKLAESAAIQAEADIIQARDELEQANATIAAAAIEPWYLKQYDLLDLFFQMAYGVVLNGTPINDYRTKHLRDEFAAHLGKVLNPNQF